jgi:glycosyltransferase involved in cell wall biosynthesis
MSATVGARGWLERLRTPVLRSASSASPNSLSDALDQGSDECRTALQNRIRVLLSALTHPVTTPDSTRLLAALELALTDLGPEKAWLAVSVLTGRFPDVATVQRTLRAARLDGVLTALFQALRQSGQLEAASWPDVEVLVGRVLVDVHHTARNLFATGIQRVARETARRWKRDHDVILLGWNEGYTGFRRLSSDEVGAALMRIGDGESASESWPEQVIVPWKCTHLVAELPVEPGRTSAYHAYVMFSRSVTGLIGYDCVPLTAAETAAEGLPIGFANYLAVAADADRVAAISEASALEFRAWRSMLAGAGQSGPNIQCVPLSVYAEVPTAAALREARELFCVGSLPIVLSVGSHEPRKNHLAVLHAAEVLWREGLLFNLVFVGGNSWSSAEFHAQVELLRRSNRPVQTAVALSDNLLWAVYRLAYCTVFPSLHEGFGLPVAESLASGTPVITSDFGSMKELSSRGGALLVDPRSDGDLTAALRRLLQSPSLRSRLAAEAFTVQTRSWDRYAAEAWAFLVDGKEP